MTVSRLWRRLGAGVLLAAAASSFLAGPGGAGPPAKGLRISEIDAFFDAPKFQTEYSVDVIDLTANPAVKQAVRAGKVTATWTLKLELVDPAGAHPVGRPDEAAAVDLSCTNAGIGLPNEPFKQVVDKRDEDSDFTWHHPSGTPVDKYHCDHTMMGPLGHQGLISVVVSDGVSECTATYKGTNSTNGSTLRKGIAGAPVCKRLHG